MEQHDEMLSTRDMASPNDRAGRGVTTSESDLPHTPGATEAQPDEYDRAAPEGEQTKRSADRQTRLVSPADQDSDAADPAARTSVSASDAGESLLSADTDATFQQRWEEIQTRFVDEPRGAVEDADGLVANLMQQLAEGFAKERERLEAHWGRGEDISTEDLRVALQRYRTFFQRLLLT